MFSPTLRSARPYPSQPVTPNTNAEVAVGSEPFSRRIEYNPVHNRGAKTAVLDECNFAFHIACKFMDDARRNEWLPGVNSLCNVGAEPEARAAENAVKVIDVDC